MLTVVGSELFKKLGDDSFMRETVRTVAKKRRNARSLKLRSTDVRIKAKRFAATSEEG